MLTNNFDYITVNKVLIQGGGLVCLQAYENDTASYIPLSAIKKVTLHDKYSHKKTVLTTNVTLADVTVTSFGTIWAIDLLGHLYCSKTGLSGENLYAELETHTFDSTWSYQGISTQTPVCLIGENDDLWIATQEGTLIHFDGQEFTMMPGMEKPIRFKKVNGQYYLMGYGCQLMRFQNGEWQVMAFDVSVPKETPINDVTYVSGHLIAVSTLGLILRQHEDKVFTKWLYTPDTPWHGCDTLQGTVYLAGGIKGAYRLVEEVSDMVGMGEVAITNKVMPIKKGHFMAVSVLDRKVIFLQASTQLANFVCYLPLSTAQWFLVMT